MDFINILSPWRERTEVRGSANPAKEEQSNMLWTITALIVLMFFIGLAAWLIFLWAAKTGQFDDIERPKHRMMDDDS